MWRVIFFTLFHKLAILKNNVVIHKQTKVFCAIGAAGLEIKHLAA
jgi:hypothetical protein